METEIPLLICIAITMVLSGFFSGMEIAFVSSNRMLAEMDREDSGLSGKIIWTPEIEQKLENVQPSDLWELIELLS